MFPNRNEQDIFFCMLIAAWHSQHLIKYSYYSLVNLNPSNWWGGASRGECGVNISDWSSTNGSWGAFALRHVILASHCPTDAPSSQSAVDDRLDLSTQATFFLLLGYHCSSLGPLKDTDCFRPGPPHESCSFGDALTRNLAVIKL